MNERERVVERERERVREREIRWYDRKNRNELFIITVSQP